MKNKELNPIVFFIIGVVLFFVRYIPIYHLQINDLVSKWFSVSSASKVCNSLLGALIKQCAWVNPINGILIFGAILFIVAGVIIVYKNK